jgi:hypothetical protein
VVCLVVSDGVGLERRRVGTLCSLSKSGRADLKTAPERSISQLDQFATEGDIVSINVELIFHLKLATGIMYCY